MTEPQIKSSHPQLSGVASRVGIFYMGSQQDSHILHRLGELGRVAGRVGKVYASNWSARTSAG